MTSQETPTDTQALRDYATSLAIDHMAELVARDASDEPATLSRKEKSNALARMCGLIKGTPEWEFNRAVEKVATPAFATPIGTYTWSTPTYDTTYRERDGNARGHESQSRRGRRRNGPARGRSRR